MGAERPQLPPVGVATRWRKLLDDVVSGVEPVPGYVTRMALGRLRGWKLGVAHGELRIPADLSVVPETIFGGYSSAVVDQFAGFAMFTVMPDRSSALLTKRLEVEFVAPLRPGEARVRGRVVGWRDARTADVEIEIEQRGKVTSRGRAVQVLA